MAAHTDDGFHEIQLNGKQLVFLFMAATVVSVVIFLCGVLVGRGVRNERAGEAQAAELNAAEPTPQASATPEPTPPGSDPTVAAPPPASDELSFDERLRTSTSPKEELKPQSAQSAQSAPKPAAAAAAPPRAVTPPPPPAKPEPPKPTPAKAPAPVNEGVKPVTTPPAREPAGTGYAVQIAALNIRSEADAIAKRFASKGYAAYVMTPAMGTPQIYRVRIGKFGSRREAESIAAKLEKEEQLKPWVTR